MLGSHATRRLILVLAEVCDYVKNGQVKATELLDQILKRLKQTRKTKLQMNTLTLFDAAVKNCGQQFHQLFTSRATMNVLVEVIDDTRTENTVRNRIGSLLKQWMDDPEFRDKAQYAMLGATYKKLTTEKGYTFIDGSGYQPMSSSTAPAPMTVTGAAARRTQDDLLAKKEEEEFAKASEWFDRRTIRNLAFVVFQLPYRCKRRISRDRQQRQTRSIRRCSHPLPTIRRRR